MRRLIPVLAFVLALGGSLWGEVGGDISEAITDAGATTVTFASFKTSVRFTNNVGSANEVYIRLYWCGETISDVTTATAKLVYFPGESESFTFNSRSETPGIGYCGFSAITDAGDTATIRYVAK